ncbi:MAG: site-specific integrase [Bacteroidetes bacterium]|nr:site-specific integrase [Bacteroidota bacterium]MCX7119798.1 site-specific integrase [Legionellales bacterium]
MKNSNHGFKEISISYLLRKAYRLKNGECPIVVKIQYQGERKEINTGLSAKSLDWDAKEGCVSANNKKAMAINKDLARIQNDIDERFIEMRRTIGDFSLGELIERLKGKSNAPQTIEEYLKIKIDDYQGRIGIDLAQTTFYKYRRTATYFQDFLFDKLGQKNLAVTRINKLLLEDFFKYLRKEKKNSHNSSSALMNCLNSILDDAEKAGIIRFNPFKEILLTRKPVNREYLTSDEILAMQKLDNLIPSLDRNRDLFLLACFTGLAYSDIKALHALNIIVEPDGSKHIERYRTKSMVMSYIPLLTAAENILLKYSPTKDCRDFQWKVPCNQKLNQSLKEIAKLAGIHRNLFMHLGRHTFATTVTLSQGISIESVSKMLGHTTLKHTQVYAKIVNSKVKGEMEKLKGSFL